MRKTLSTIFLMIFLVCPILAQNHKSEREHEKLIGPVKTIKVVNAGMDEKSGKWVEKKHKLERIVSYNEAGNKTKELVYDGQAESTITYSYDKNGTRTASSFSKNVPTYFQSGNDRTGGVPSQERTNVSKLTFKFDERGNRIEQVQSPNGGLIEQHNRPAKNVYTYDENDNLKELAVYTRSGFLLGRNVYKTDSKGNVLEQEQQSPDRSVIRKYSFTYEFDSRGNWIKRIGSKWEHRGKNSRFEPKEVTYREITYY